MKVEQAELVGRIGLPLGLLGVVLSGLVWPLAAQESRFAHTDSRSVYVHRIELYDVNEKRIDPQDPLAPPYSPLKTCGKCHDYEQISHGFHFGAMMERAQPSAPAAAASPVASPADVPAAAGTVAAAPETEVNERAGEPWIWVDSRTGTQIPLSYRGWQGSYHPDELGISPWELVVKLGHHMPGGGLGELGGAAAAQTPPAATGEAAAAATATAQPAATPAGNPGRWQLSGKLEVDCMFCHSDNRLHSKEAWQEQIDNENFAWAATAALGLAKIEGRVKSLPASFQPPAKPEEGGSSGPQLPKTVYNLNFFNPEGLVYFDIVRKPHNNSCYHCHTTMAVGPGAPEKWACDEDVHVKAGLACADCHRNEIGHHTVRGYEGEINPSGQSVATLSCRGCHLDQEVDGQLQPGGRLGAPKPLHKGIPPLHFDKMSCTSCHSGPLPAAQVGQIQTALAHGLGIRSHDYKPTNPPGIVAPVLLRDEHQVLYPYRMMWPAFWGKLQDGKVTPLNPEQAYDLLRKVLRVRKDFTEEMMEVRLSADDKKEILGERATVPEAQLTEEEKAKLAVRQRTRGLEEFQKKLGGALQTLTAALGQEGVEGVYVSGGRGYRLDPAAKEPQDKEEAVKVVTFETEAATPYAWKMAHDVRPARWSTGAQSCYECHAAGAPLFEGQVVALGPAPTDTPRSEVLYKLQGFDKALIDVRNLSFQGRTMFKVMGLAAMSLVGLILLLHIFIGLNGLFRLIVGRR